MAEIKIVTIQQLIDRTHEAREEQDRVHLGCSIAGRKCEREIWNQFRWALTPKSGTFEDGEKFRSRGQLLRLFRRGQREEETVITDLEAIGVEVSRRQDRVSFGSFVAGSIDGVAVGVPGAPKTEHLLEIKTHGLKSFDVLSKAESVRMAKPEHFVQMQLYMLGLKLTRALYVAVCKDDDRIYTERLEFDRGFAEHALERAQMIALSERAPPKISERSNWYECKMCDSFDLCHGSKFTRRVNCRTCSHSTPREDSTWHCAKWESEIPEEGQRVGCDWHVMHPDLIGLKLESIGEQWSVAYGPFINGAGIDGAISSKEMIAKMEASLATESK